MYPSLQPTDPVMADVAADGAAIRKEKLLPLIGAGKKVVVMHSSAGIPGSVAASGLGEVERQANGEKGGAVGLVFLSGFVVAEGVLLLMDREELCLHGFPKIICIPSLHVCGPIQSNDSNSLLLA